MFAMQGPFLWGLIKEIQGCELSLCLVLEKIMHFNSFATL